MIKRLVRHGNSRALIIDKPILELLGATEDSEFTITTDGRSLTITPVSSAEEERHLAFEYAAETALKRYGDTFTIPRGVYPEEGARISWSPAWSLTHHRVRYLPTATCFYGFIDPGSMFARWAGLAEGFGLFRAVRNARSHGQS